VAGRHLHGCSSHLCWLRTDGLASKPSSLSLTEAWLNYYFIGWLGRETGYRHTNWSAGMLWIVSGALFLRSSGIHPNLSTTRERLPHTGTAHRKHTPGVRVMLIRFSSAWYTSIRIGMTLGYE
jgi:hypothetical protein